LAALGLFLMVAQAKYSAFDQKLLTISAAIRWFWHVVEGRAFTVFTDHQPLTTAMTSSSLQQTARQERHLQFISEFTTDIQHILRKANVVANALLQAPLEGLVGKVTTLVGIDFSALAQSKCCSSDTGMTATEITGLKWHLVTVEGQKLRCDISTKSHGLLYLRK